MPTSTLTPKQKQVLRLVERSVEERGYPPSLRELAAELGLSGTRAVEKHLAALQKMGALKRGPGARALSLPERGLPILGRVAAGRPILAEENVEGRLRLDPSWSRKGAFLLRVRGQSMTGAGILDGDLVLVRPQPDAASGELVVALIDDEATVKRLHKGARGVELRAENPAFAPIRPKPGEALRIVGRVAGVFRVPA